MCLGGIFNEIRKTMAELTNGFQRRAWPRAEGGTLWLQRPGPRAIKETQGPTVLPHVHLPFVLLPTQYDLKWGSFSVIL